MRIPIRLAAFGAGILLTTTLAGCASSGGTGAKTSGSSAPNPLSGAVIAIKIDNVAEARPSTGLGKAQVVYVEPVEGGLTRLVAVFAPPFPALVGPVRSARRTDLDLLAQYGRPTFAFSGAVPQLIPLINGASLINASQSTTPGAYVRQSTHPAPHNLYVRPAQLPTGNAPAQPPLEFGTAPSGGTPATQQHVAYPNASFEFTWSAGQWLVAVDGTPYRTTDAGQLGAATVVIQHVVTHPEQWPEDSTGAVAPVAQTVGTGSATVLRGGDSYAATWSRTDPGSPTRFTVSSSGADLPLASGQVWILLVPTG